MRSLAALAVLCVSVHSALAASGSGDSHAADNATHAESHAGHEQHPHETLVFLFGSILVGTAVLHACNHPWLHGLPITVVIFVLGIILALIAEVGCWGEAEMLCRSYQNWVAIDPHLLLFTFLPPLLCGDAMTIDTHIAKRTAGQCLILAGPGVVIGSFATAAVLYGVLPYNWDFPLCVTVGSILAATDPVAVVSLLKDLGASPVLTMQIQGESLLNDGTAIVLFSIAYEIAGGKSYSALDVFVELLKSTVGASAVGILIGILFVVWIGTANDKLQHNSSLIQICLTILCAYWSFIFAEGVLHISGVLSTVSSSLVLAHKVWLQLVSQHAMHEIWHVIETLGNVLVFFLAGVLTGKQLLQRPAEDYGWTFLIYILMVFIRLFMFIGLWPILNRAGRPITFAEVLVMTWGGLRGMVGLALAILVSKDRAYGNISELDGDRILFMVGGVAALTLLVNATTAPALCGLLGITQQPQDRQALVRNVARLARSSVMSMIDEMDEDRTTVKSCAMGIVRETLDSLHEEVQHHLHVDPDAEEEDEQSILPRLSQIRPSMMLGNLGNTGGQRASRVSISSGVQDLRKGGLKRIAHFFRSGTMADTELLWQEFEHHRRLLMQTGAEIRAFQFGKQLPQIRYMLNNVPMDNAKLKLVREAFLEAVRANYWEQHKHGKFVGSEGLRGLTILLNSVNLARETSSVGLQDWPVIESELMIVGEEALKDKAKHHRLFTSAALRKTLRLTSFDESSSKTPPSSAVGTGIVPDGSSQPFDGSNDKVEETPVEQLGSSATIATNASQKSVPARRESTESVSRFSSNGDDDGTPWVLRKVREQKLKWKFENEMMAIQVIEGFIQAHEDAQTKVAEYFGRDERVDTPEEAYVILESQTQIFQGLIVRHGMDRTVQKKANTWWQINRLIDHYREFVLKAVTHGVIHSKEAEVLLHPIASTIAKSNKDRKEYKRRKEMTKTDAASLVQRAWRSHQTREKVQKSVKSRMSFAKVADTMTAASKFQKLIRVKEEKEPTAVPGQIEEEPLVPPNDPPQVERDLIEEEA